MKNFICEFNRSGVAYLNLQFKPFLHNMHLSKKFMTYPSYGSLVSATRPTKTETKGSDDDDVCIKSVNNSYPQS